MLAIWLSVTFYLNSKNAERNAAISVNKIEEATRTLSNLSLRMINRLTTAIITPKPTDEKLSDILREVKNTGLLVEGEEISGATKAQLEQFRIDNLIAAFYYCGLTNISTQFFLPSTIGDIIGNEGITNIIDQSKNDYDILKSWILGSDKIELKIISSPVKHMYEQAISWDTDIKSTSEYYAAKDSETV